MYEIQLLPLAHAHQLPPPALIGGRLVTSSIDVAEGLVACSVCAVHGSRFQDTWKSICCDHLHRQACTSAQLLRTRASTLSNVVLPNERIFLLVLFLSNYWFMVMNKLPCSLPKQGV